MLTLLALLIVAAPTPLDAAATAALREAWQLAGKGRYEYAGVIWSCGTVASMRGVGPSYSYTSPQRSTGEPDTFSITVKQPHGCTLAAIYHTHPGQKLKDARQLSDSDVRMMHRFKVPSYIMTTYDGTMLVANMATCTNMFRNCDGRELAP